MRWLGELFLRQLSQEKNGRKSSTKTKNGRMQTYFFDTFIGINTKEIPEKKFYIFFVSFNELSKEM